MKHTLLFILALSVAAPAAATDDDKTPEKPAAVEVLALEKLPLPAVVPTELDAPVISEGEAERPGCFRQTGSERIKMTQYFMTVGLVMDVPPLWNVYGSVALGSIGYIQCKVQRRREKRSQE